MFDFYNNAMKQIIIAILLVKKLDTKRKYGTNLSQDHGATES
jgi:hypothetical protein